MTQYKVLAMIFCISAVTLAITPGAKADPYNKKTIVTFNNPVEIPGVGTQLLPAGTYVFKLVDSVSTRDIVQIFNKEETHVYATVLAIPNYRLRATGKTVMTFKERAAGAPEAIRAWFYPGNIDGQEFVYPKARAMEIAKISNEPVLTMPSPLAEEITAPVKTTEVPPLEGWKEAPLMAMEPSGEEVEIAQVIPPKSLPKTASPLPLLGLMGLLSLGTGSALWAFLKRAA